MEANLEQNNQMQLSRNENLQMMPIEDAQAWYKSFCDFSTSIMKSDLDYGVIPGTNKPSLYKAGAEKLRFVYGLTAEFECTDKVVDLDKPFIDYSYKCSIKSKTGQTLAQCEGNCNSMEPKFGYLWKTANELPEGTDFSKLPSKTSGRKLSEFSFAIDKAETGGQYGKPAEYWNNWKAAIQSGKAKKVVKQSKNGKSLDAYELDETVTVYRILNPDVIGVKNTIMKMAQKRAFVGAILLATGASEFYTQDIEDMELNGTIHSNEKNVPFDEAEIISETPNTSQQQSKQKQETKSDDRESYLPGHWYAKMEKCKTKEDVDDLAVLNKETIMANPQLRSLFGETKAKLPSKLNSVAHV